MNMSIREVFVTALLSAAVVAGTAIAATQHDHESAVPDASSVQAVATDHHEMMTEMQASQAKLDELVAQMNAATGPEKVDRIAAVVTEMVAMHKRMNAMVSGMMQGGMMQNQMKMHVHQEP
jgi:hypothetical protein